MTITCPPGNKPDRPPMPPPDLDCNILSATSAPHEGHAASPEDINNICEVSVEVSLLKPVWTWAQSSGWSQFPA